jgi:hypothetical protein
MIWLARRVLEAILMANNQRDVRRFQDATARTRDQAKSIG